MSILFVDTGDKKLRFSTIKVDIRTERDSYFSAVSPLTVPFTVCVAKQGAVLRLKTDE